MSPTIPYNVGVNALPKLLGQDDQPIVISVKDIAGENTYLDSASIPDNISTKLLNVDINIAGERTKRKGYALIGDDLGSKTINSLGAFAAAVGGAQKLYMSTNGSWYELDTEGGTWSSIQGSLSEVDSEFVVAENLCFIINTTDNVHSYDGTTVTDEGNTNTDPPRGKVGCYFQNRFWVANDSTNPDYVWYSDVADSQTFDRSTNVFKVSPGGNDQITGLMPFRKSRELYIFKEDSIHKLTCAGATSAWYLSEVDTTHGCIAPRTIRVVGNDIYYLSRDGVRSIKTTEFNIEQGIDLPLSVVEKTIWDTRNDAQISNACAGDLEGIYYVSFATGSSTTNDTTLVYFISRNGWSHYTGLAPAVWVNWVISNEERIYFGEDAADSKVYRFLSTQADAGSAITCQEETKDYDFGFPAHWKVGGYLEVRAKASGDYDITVSAQLDTGGFQSLGTFSLLGTAPTLPVDLPFDLDESNILSEIFYLNGLGRYKRIMFKFVENTSTSDEIKILDHDVRTYLEPFQSG